MHIGSYQLLYCKSSCIGALKALAQEVAIMAITVNAVALGFIKTTMIKDIDAESYIKAILIGKVENPRKLLTW